MASRLKTLGMKLRSMLHFGSGSGSSFVMFDSNLNTVSGKSERLNYAAKVGNGTSVSVVMAVLQFIQRAWQESDLAISLPDDDDGFEFEHGSEAVNLIANPNPAYTDEELWSATKYSYLWAGNAYWLKVRNGLGRVVELWWTPHWLIEPVWPADGSEFISSYKYRPGNREPIFIDPVDVIHFRHGIDPSNPRKGISIVQSALPEIFVDMEASDMAAGSAINQGVPGLIVSPVGEDATIDPTVAKETERYINTKTTGKNRGRTLVMTGQTRVEQFGFSPKDMNLDNMHNMAEERVCSLVGIPSAVVGFREGLQQTRVGASMTELRKLAWSNGIIPIQRTLTRQLTRQLPLSEFDNRQGAKFAFDNRNVEALQESRNDQVDRLDKRIRGGWLSVADAKKQLGEEPAAGDAVYLRGFSVIEVPAETGVRPQPEPGEPKARKAHTHNHTLLEERIAAEAPSSTPTESEIQYAAALTALRENLQAKFEPELVKVFNGLGAKLTDRAGPILREEFANVAERKEQSNLEDLTQRMMEAAALAETQPILAEIYERHYLRVAQGVSEQGQIIGIATDLPDEVARAVVATGGRRAGLIDLEEQSRKRLFEVLTTARAEGLGADETMRRIRDEIPAGPWRTVETRGRVIARTETMYARNVSAVERGRAAGTDQFLIFDSVLGSFDEVCDAMNGKVVTHDEALQLTEDEHPSGTRSFVARFSN